MLASTGTHCEGAQVDMRATESRTVKLVSPPHRPSVEKDGRPAIMILSHARHVRAGESSSTAGRGREAIKVIGGVKRLQV